MRTLALAAFCALAAGATASADGPEAEDAQPEEAQARDCFRTRSVSGFNVVDRGTVRLSTTPSRIYEVDVARAGCFSLSFAHSIAIESGRVSGNICVGDGPFAGRIFSDDGDRCRITAVRRVDLEAEAAAEAATGSAEESPAQ